MKKSFFGNYFLYKLRGFRGIAVVSAVLNFLSTTLVGADILFLVNLLKKTYETDDPVEGYISVIVVSLIAAAVAVIALTVIITITPAVGFKFYNDRPAADTIGSLPLTYGQRFWGDFLSGFGAYMISFIPCSAAGLIFAAAAKSGAGDTLRDPTIIGLVGDFSVSLGVDPVRLYMALILTLFVGYIGAYALSCFVTACCGRTGSAVMYSLISLFIPAGLVMVYCYCAFKNAVGIEVIHEAMRATAVLPPVGTWFNAVIRYNYATFFYGVEESLGKLCFLVDEPGYLIVLSIIVAALIVGAYFLGKFRKAERTGVDFVYKGAYHVISVSIIAFVIGLFFMTREMYMKPVDIFFSVLLSLVLYVVIDLVHTRSVKKLWQTALRYAAILTACYGFITSANNTGGFGAEKYLPPRSAISEVRISGAEFLNFPNFSALDPDSNCFVYRSDEAISTILNEHEKLIGDLGELDTSDLLAITYVLKNGSEVNRYYGCDTKLSESESNTYKFEMESKTLREVCAAIKQLEPTDSSALGFIDAPRYDSIKIGYSEYVRGAKYANIPMEAVFITEGKEAEFMELLKHDMINNYTFNYDYRGVVRISYTLNGISDYEQYTIIGEYADTLMFLNDPANVAGEPPEEKLEYTIGFSPNRQDIFSSVITETPDEKLETIGKITVRVSADDDSEAARELLGYLRKYKDASDIEEGSERITVYTNDWDTVYVAEEDESAVIKAMLKYILTIRQAE